MTKAGVGAKWPWSCAWKFPHETRDFADPPLAVGRAEGVPGELYVHLSGRPTWGKVREDALGIATTLERDHPELVVSNMRKSLRVSKVLIDWSQNHPAKTTVAAYSVRARPEPTVSTPVTWDEVEQCHELGDPDRLTFTTADVLERIERHGDLFADI